MLRIVTLGLPQVATSPPPPLRVADSTAEPETFEDLVSRVAPATADEVVLVLVSERDSEPRVSRLLAARSALETTRVVVHTTGLPPLGAGVLAELVAGLSHERLVPDGVLLSQLPLLERQVVAVAWLGSVARLRHPSPSVRMHARSMLPGSSFLAVVDQEPRVTAVPRNATPTPPSAVGQGEGWKLVLATGEGVDDTVVRRWLDEQLPDARLETTSLTAVSTSWWGTDQLSELAFAPADIRTLATTLRAAPTTTCAWCQRDIASGPCPLCRFAVVGAAAADEKIESGESA